MAKLTPSIGICFVSSSLHAIHETVLDGINILLVLQQDVRTYAGNLIYGVRLQVNMGDRLAKKISLICSANQWTGFWFFIKDFFGKCDQIWSHLLKKSLMENFIFCAVVNRSKLCVNCAFPQNFTPEN